MRQALLLGVGIEFLVGPKEVSNDGSFKPLEDLLDVGMPAPRALVV
ncbi:MAG: hypothetical protein RBG13Loki_0906 [Promethearchaeota archaeon CR_4]|nr:MAG: hypothetical protein RBG13Loki_0906 [Candidatus Lokiarchaeota archaeon CR_4]